MSYLPESAFVLALVVFGWLAPIEYRDLVNSTPRFER